MAVAAELIIRYLPEHGAVPSTNSPEKKQEKKADDSIAFAKQLMGAVPGGSQAMGAVNTAAGVAENIGQLSSASALKAASGALGLATLAYSIGKAAYDAWRNYDRDQRQSAELRRRAGYQTRG